MDQQAAADDVCHRIQGADFMEMDLFNWCAVRMGFRFADQTVDGVSVLFDRIRQIKRPNQVTDILIAVMGVRMGMDMRFFMRMGVDMRFFMRMGMDMRFAMRVGMDMRFAMRMGMDVRFFMRMGVDMRSLPAGLFFAMHAD